MTDKTTNIPEGGVPMPEDARIILIYSELPQGYCLLMPVVDWVRYLRYVADQLESAKGGNTFEAVLQTNGVFRMRMSDKHWSEMGIPQPVQPEPPVNGNGDEGQTP